ncbi:hypothetical protein QTP86_012036 [Hemibagrus guttatus]|nr:hypothetical protein QTP86_012036 [Hemibagrus guttatus]
MRCGVRQVLRQYEEWCETRWGSADWPEEETVKINTPTCDPVRGSGMTSGCSHRVTRQEPQRSVIGQWPRLGGA